MKRITLLALLFIAQWLNRSESCDPQDQEMALNEHIRELWNQVDTLEFLVNLIIKNPFFQNSAGICPHQLGSRQVPCQTPNGQCLCIGDATVSVSWYRADAFCKYYGMDLISIDDEFVRVASSPSVQSALQPGQKFWTSARNLLQPDFWFWTGNGVPINASSISNLNKSTEPPHCMTWDLASEFRQTACFGDDSKISFICQQNFKQIDL